MSDISLEHREAEKKPKSYIRDYWGNRADSFKEQRRKELHSDKLALWKEEILEQLPQDRPLRILDIGCGAGFFSILLAKEGHTVSGIDITPNMIEAAKQLAEEEACKAQFVVMDAEQLAYDDESFDVVIARNVTWNLVHPLVAYAEWLRVLKSDGLLLNYDAEYAKGHHHRPQVEHHAHEDLPEGLLRRCHHIYHMLAISRFDRPQWDKDVLHELGAFCTIDVTISDRLYKKKDIFYMPVSMFRVKAIKKK